MRWPPGKTISVAQIVDALEEQPFRTDRVQCAVRFLRARSGCRIPRQLATHQHRCSRGAERHQSGRHVQPVPVAVRPDSIATRVAPETFAGKLKTQMEWRSNP